MHPNVQADELDPAVFQEGWQRGCENVKYFQNDISRYGCETARKATQVNKDRFLQENNGHGEGIDTFFTLSFDYKFEFTEDEVWFAHAVPYTYS